MASIRRRGKHWRAEICVDGVRKSSTFSTMRDAKAWASEEVTRIKAVSAGGVPDLPVRYLLDRYGSEVSSKKRGVAAELIRLARLSRDALADVSLCRLSSADLALWRDRRLEYVKSSSVLRDWSLLGHVFSVAVKEWRILKENPLLSVSRPRSLPSRDRLISADEIERVILASGYAPDCVDTITARVGAAFLFAIETAMRAGEICSLRWPMVSGNVAKLAITKNGFPRQVPLSSQALKILSSLPVVPDDDRVFRLAASQVDALFRKIKKRALIEDLHFHDTRHEAITRLARRLDVLDLARMVGIRNLRILMVYYNAKPEDIALRLG
ncbi:MAG: site-specific integrase [Zoogloeaceae bacterium]|jgi:integrase|nr:site-specific integrase [Zoogloeaceae bacterium]